MRPSELPDLPGWVVVCVDTETSGLHHDDERTPEGGRPGISAVSIAWTDPDTGAVRAYAYPFDQGVRDKLPAITQGTLFEDEDPNLPADEWDALMRWLDQRPLAFHNAPFDMRWLRHGTRHYEGWDLERQYVWDTAVVAKAVWPDESAALKTTGARLKLEGGDEQETQSELLRWIKKAKLGKGIGTARNPRYDLVPWAVMEPYSRNDAYLTELLRRSELRHLEDCDWGVYRQLRRELEHARTIYSIERRGMGFDIEACKVAAAQLEGRLAKLATELPFEPATEAAAKTWFFDTLGLEVIKRTKPRFNKKTGQMTPGQIALDDQVRTRLIRLEIEGAAEWDQYAKAKRAVEMWYRGWPPLVGDDGRLRTMFKQLHVRSGRLSVERVQLHAIPKDNKRIEGVPTVRSFFQARPGHTLWNLDLQQAELRVAAKQSNCQRMIGMLAEGADLHGLTTKAIFRIDEETSDWKYKRDIGKRLTFSSIFQIGPTAFQETLAKEAGIDWTIRQCEEVVYAWRDLYPEFTSMYYSWMKRVEVQGWISLVQGERTYFWTALDRPNTGWSRRVQGSLAIFVKAWLNDAERTCARMGVPEALIGTVHDSIVLELPDEYRRADGKRWSGNGVHPVAREIAARAERAGERIFKIAMPCEGGRWHKD